MASSKLFRFLLSLRVPLIITITIIIPSQATEYFFKSNICSGNNVTVFNSTFLQNLNHLLSPLLSTSNSAASNGFFDSSYGEIPDKAHAIGYCRGDMHPRDCATCLAARTSLILNSSCPGGGDAKEGGVGYLNCTLRYSNESISGIRVSAPSISGAENVLSSNQFDFNQRLTTLLERLRSEAAAGSGVRKFAVGHSTAPNSSGLTIYGLMQCSPDLNRTECDVCLGESLKGLPPCCYKSWTYVGASCGVKYDPDLFYEAASDPSPLPAPSGGNDSNESGISPRVFTIQSFLAPIIISMVLIVSKC